jgi:hypothetical protein
MSTYYIYFSYLRSTIYTNKYMSNRSDLRTFCMNISSSHENMKCKDNTKSNCTCDTCDILPIADLPCWHVCVLSGPTYTANPPCCVCRCVEENKLKLYTTVLILPFFLCSACLFDAWLSIRSRLCTIYNYIVGINDQRLQLAVTFIYTVLGPTYPTNYVWVHFSS